MRAHRSSRVRVPRRSERRAILTAAGSWRAIDTSMPSTKNVISSDVPPAEISGNGMPVTGSRPLT